MRWTTSEEGNSSAAANNTVGPEAPKVALPRAEVEVEGVVEVVEVVEVVVAEGPRGVVEAVTVELGTSGRAASWSVACGKSATDLSRRIQNNT